MFGFIQASIAVFVTIGVALLFVVFTLAAAGWIRLYFNKYEPVYIKDEQENFVKNHIASRFCKIIISNVVTDKCMEDVGYIGIWSLVLKSIDYNDSEIKCISSLHLNILGAVEEHLDLDKYIKLQKCLKEIEVTLFNNLDDSNIITPPYLAISTYVIWIESAIENFKKA